ncbi:serine protease [Candidatus Gracilibacteria bacterium]|nr:serine protease [Candidatus Gracilibacteria bacterium]
MQKILCITIIFILTACGKPDFIPVEIVGKDNVYQVITRGMGILHNDILITGAHVVRNQQLQYFVGEQKYILQNIDYIKDRAFLSKTNDGFDTKKLYSFGVKGGLGDSVFAQVTRNNIIVTLTGKIIDASGSVLGYDGQGRITPIQGIILTDIQFISGDSGAPIFNVSGELIDLVHVQ